jgi:hypothetical protein
MFDEHQRAQLAYPFAAFITLGTVDIKLTNFTFETFVIDVLKPVSFGAAVRTAFDGHFANMSLREKFHSWSGGDVHGCQSDATVVRSYSRS